MNGELALPPSEFRCLLEEQPGYLVPSRCLGEDNGTGPLTVNPSARFSWTDAAGGLPKMDGLATGTGVVWIGDPNQSSFVPFHVGRQFQDLLTGLVPGDPMPPSFPPRARSILTSAGVLVAPDHPVEWRKQRSETVARCRRMFERGYAPVAGLIHPYHVGALRRYLRYIIRTGHLVLGDQQSPRRYVAHNERVVRFFHQQLTPLISELAGESLKPSYVYVASYQARAELPSHTDREQCEYSVSLLIDHSPEPARSSPWPLHLRTPGGTVTVYQAIGDGLLYRGRSIPHYRTALPDGMTSTSIFFHYVSSDFAGPLT